MAEEDAWDVDRDPDPTDPGTFTDPPTGIVIRWENGATREIEPTYVGLDDDALCLWWVPVTREEMTGVGLGLCELQVAVLPARTTLHVGAVAP